jgi:hypothetical protein
MFQVLEFVDDHGNEVGRTRRTYVLVRLKDDLLYVEGNTKKIIAASFKTRLIKKNLWI